MQDIDFDLAGARKAGAKPAQLSSYFKSNFNLDFDFDGAYKAGATDNQILSYLNQSYSDLKKKGNSGVDSGVKSSPTPSKYTLKEEAPKKQYYSSKLEKGLIFDKEGQLYAPSSEALTKAIAPPAEDLNLKKSTQKDLVEQSRVPEEKPKKQISIEPSFTSPLFGSPLEVKFLEEGEDPSILAGFTSSTLKGQIQGKVANILSAGKRPTPEELGEIAQLQSDLQLFPQSKSERVYQEKGLKGLFVDSPTLGVEFVAETMLSSLSALFEASKRTVPTAVAAGAVAGAPFAGVGAIPGATYGFLSGQLAAGYNLSTSQDILNSLSDNGVDISNKESLIKAFSDEKKMAKIRNTAAKYGIPILLFDAATAGLAGKFAAGAIGKSLSRKLLAGLGETGIQIGGGMGGEFTGQLASGKKVNWDDVVMEGLAEVPGGAVEVVTGLQLERSKTASNNKTLATQIATQGIQNGTEDAIVNLNRDLANNVITPEQHQEGVVFVEKAAQVVDKIPETVTGENKAKSIELLVERNDIKESNEILLQQKQASDEAYHAGINEEIKANDEKIKKINEEVFNIAKEPVVEKVEQPIVEKPVEVVEEQAVVEKPKLADKLSTFKEKYTLISEGAAKAIETKKINQQAGKIVPMDKEAAVLAWLSGNNELSWKAINEAAGRKEQARLNVGKDYSTEEVKIRDYAAKKRDGGETLRNAAHKIWEDLTKRTGDKNITTRDVAGALLNAIRENPTRIDAAKNLINIAGAEEAPISIEEGAEDFYKRKGEQPTEPVVEQGMPQGGFVPFQEGEEEIQFSVQELPTDEVNDMKEIVKDLVEEGLNLNAIRNRISKELGYDSKRLKETVNKAYQEYTKEFTPKEVTKGIIAEVGQFVSDLFGGKAKDKVVILKDDQSVFAKASQLEQEGGKIDYDLKEANEQASQVKLEKDKDGNLIAPNGKKSNLNEIQWKLVRTPAFKSWAGEKWESVLKDDNGEPRVVYHGTFSPNPKYGQQDFYTFSRKWSETNDTGFHFGTKEAAEARIADLTELSKKGYLFARDTERPRMLPVFLKTGNALRLPEDDRLPDWRGYRIVQKIFDGIENGTLDKSAEKAFEKDIDKFYDDKLLKNYPENKPEKENKWVGDYLKKKGYDSIEYSNVVEDKGKDSYIVFRPEQVKLADGSNITFGESGDIRFQIEGGFRGTNDMPIAYRYDTNQVARERFDIPKLKKIGEGSDRVVFDLKDGKVLKVAKTPRGLEQNIYEGDYYLSGTILPETFERGLNYVVVEKISPAITRTIDLGIADINIESDKKGIGKLNDLLKKLKQFTQKDFDNHNSDLQDILAEYDLTDIMNYDVIWNDFTAKRNWGLKDGEPLHLDGGTFGGIQMLDRFKGQKPLSDSEFRDIYNKSKKAKIENKDVDKFTKFMAKPSGDILGFTYDKKIYLNAEKLNPNTPIHEAGHIWTEWVKQNDNKIYQRGIELVKNSDYLKEVKSSKFYQEQAKKLATKQEAELYFQHEALAMAIGDKGAQFVTESKRTSFKEWLDTLWTKIRDLAGFKDITAEELQNVTFEEFTKMAVKDILGKQFEGRTLQEIYETLPMGKKLRQNKEEILIRDNFDNIVAELIKNNKIEKIC